MRSLLYSCSLFFVATCMSLPLNAPKSSELGTAAIGDSEKSNERIFVVEVKESPRPQQRKFPWAYPPIFEPVLPEPVKQQLTQIYEDSSLSEEERSNQVNAVFDSLPQQIIEALPLPVEYERLPFDVYKRIHYIHVAPGFKWAERQQLIQQIVESLPEEQRLQMNTPRIGGPPPGFEYVLAPTIYKQLLFVHYNPQLTKEQKSEMITRIMRQVPAEQLNQLPLPSGMDRLPVEIQKRLHSLVYDYSVPQAVRARRVRDFVDTLPAEIRPTLRR